MGRDVLRLGCCGRHGRHAGQEKGPTTAVSGRRLLSGTASGNTYQSVSGTSELYGEHSEAGQLCGVHQQQVQDRTN
jgi:hypothetical protein